MSIFRISYCSALKHILMLLNSKTKCTMLIYAFFYPNIGLKLKHVGLAEEKQKRRCKGGLTMGQAQVGGEAKAGRLTWRWALTRQEEGQRERSGQSS